MHASFVSIQTMNQDKINIKSNYDSYIENILIQIHKEKDRL